MHIISRDAPCYYLTTVTKNRLPVFRTDRICEIVCQALDEARRSGGFALYAYVIMPDHLTFDYEFCPVTKKDVAIRQWNHRATSHQLSKRAKL
jgi:REP element-mobilizing transposase RayT